MKKMMIALIERSMGRKVFWSLFWNVAFIAWCVGWIAFGQTILVSDTVANIVLAIAACSTNAFLQSLPTNIPQLWWNIGVFIGVVLIIAAMLNEYSIFLSVEERTVTVDARTGRVMQERKA